MSLRVAAVALSALLASGVAYADRDTTRRDEQRPQAALFLFSGEQFSGDVRQIFEPMPALPDRDFNDRTRSVAVIEGQWELCEHADFTGLCVFVRDDVEDLAAFGLSRRVSSARPIYEYTEARHGLLFSRDREGRIRYAEADTHDERTYRRGYASETRLNVYHYGYSPQYRRQGYYDPLFGYDPYGFGYGRSNYYRHGHYYDPFNDPWRSERRYYGARNGAVTLFQHSNGNGIQLGLNASLEDLRRYRLNDTISSLYVREGQWEVCSDAYFGGECRIVDASNGVINLSGFNDRVSSVRRVDGGTTTPQPRPDRPGRRGHQEDVSGVVPGSFGGSNSDRIVIDTAPDYSGVTRPTPDAPVYDVPAREPEIAPQDIAQPVRRGGGGARRVPDLGGGRASDPQPVFEAPRDFPTQPVYEAPTSSYDPPAPSYEPPPRFDPPPSIPDRPSPTQPDFDRALD